ncbi:MAG: hypothetical protein ACFFEL_13790, partial [Candidatus Thorarchaeota archaeon]
TYYHYTDLVSPELSFANLTRLFAAIFICIPAAYMNRKLAKSPMKSLDPGTGLSVLLGTIVLATYFSNRFPPWELTWLFDPGFYWAYIWDLDKFGLLIVTFLIIVPIIIRETKIVWDFRKGPNETIDGINTNQKKVLESPENGLSYRYLILGILFGLIAVVIPNQIYISELGSLPPPNNSFSIDGATLFFHFGIRNQPIPYNMLDIVFRIESPIDMLNQLPYAGFQLLIIFGLLQYLRGNITKMRILILGVLSLVVPYAYRASANIVYNVGEEYIIPIPVVLLIGILVLKIAKPIDITLLSQKKSILEMTKSSIPPIQRDRIQIPFLYVIKSKFSSFMRRISGKTTSIKTTDRN